MDGFAGSWAWAEEALDMLGTMVEANAVLDLIGRLERGVLV